MRAIRVKRLYDGTGAPPAEDVTVVFGEEGIAEILPPGGGEGLLRYGLSRAEDASSLVMTPGLIDAHVHLMLPGDGRLGEDVMSALSAGEIQLLAHRNAVDALSHGVTSMRECGSAYGVGFALKRYYGAGYEIGPDLFVCGEPITSTGGHCHYMGGECDGAEDLRRRVRALQKRGADYIKLMATTGGTRGAAKGDTFSKEELAAAAQEAHRRGLKIAMHAVYPAGVRLALEAGCDGVEHCTFVENGRVVRDRALAEEIIRRGALPCHTLAVKTGRLATLRAKAASERTAAEDAELEQAKRNVELSVEMVRFQLELGVPSMVGSDAGWRYATFRDGMQLSMELLREAGMANGEIIRSATSLTAGWLGAGDRLGRVAPGFQADLLLLEGDPGEDISAFRKIRRIFKKGIEIPAGA